LVPVVFFFIRFWGSIRAILYFAHASDSEHYDNVDIFLRYLQAFFDPSQGFFNALLFVVTSTEGRSNVKLAFGYLSRYFRPISEQFCPSEKRRTASATGSSNEMSSGEFLASKRKHGSGTGTGLTEHFVTAPSNMTQQTIESDMDIYDIRDTDIGSSFSGNRDFTMDSQSRRRTEELDFLTVPEDVTVSALVRNSMHSIY
jgi:hypothetical protein